MNGFVKINFKFHYKAQFGYCIYIIGDIDLLGDWDINKAFRLNWTNVHYIYNFFYKFFFFFLYVCSDKKKKKKLLK